MARNAYTIRDSLFAHAIERGLLVYPFIQSRFGINYAILASEMVSWEEVLDAYENEAYLATATQEDNIEKTALPFYARHHATPSNTVLKIYWDIPANQRVDKVFPALTVVTVAEANPIMYATMEETVLYSTVEYVLVPAKSLNVGADTMVEAGDLTVIEPSVAGVCVTNPEKSWGGTDDETITDVRDHALSARFSYERGTESAIRLELELNMGLQRWEYNLVDCAFDNGSFGLWVDTTVDDFLEAIGQRVDQIKGHGIYAVYNKALPIEFDFDFKIKVANNTDLTPIERENIANAVEESFKTFILKNGVGKKVIMSQAIHAIYTDLMNQTGLLSDKTATVGFFDIHIQTLNNTYKLDDDGNIELERNEVIKVSNVTISIDTS